MKESVGNAARAQNAAEFATHPTNNLPNINQPTIIQPPSLPKMSPVYTNQPTVESPRLDAQPLYRGPNAPSPRLPPSPHNPGNVQSTEARHHQPNNNLSSEEEQLISALMEENPELVAAAINAQSKPDLVVNELEVFHDVLRQFLKELPLGSPFGPFNDDLFPEAVGPRKEYWIEVPVEGFEADGKRMRESARRYRPDKICQWNTVFSKPYLYYVDPEAAPVADCEGFFRTRKTPWDFVEGEEYRSTRKITKWRYQARLEVTVIGQRRNKDGVREGINNVIPACYIPARLVQRKGITTETEPSWDEIRSIIQKDVLNRVFPTGPMALQPRNPQLPTPKMPTLRIPTSQIPTQMPTQMPTPQMPGPQQKTPPMDYHLWEARQKENKQKENEQKEKMRKQALQIEAQKQAHGPQLQTMQPQIPYFPTMQDQLTPIYPQDRQMGGPVPQPPKVDANAPTQKVSSEAGSPNQACASPGGGSGKKESIPQFEKYTVDGLPNIKTMHPQNANGALTPKMIATALPLASSSSSHSSGSGKRRASELGPQSPRKKFAGSTSQNGSGAHLPQETGKCHSSPQPSANTSGAQPQDLGDANQGPPSVPRQSNKRNPPNQQARGSDSNHVPSSVRQQQHNTNNEPQVTPPSQNYRQAARSGYSPGFGSPQQRQFVPNNRGSQQTQLMGNHLVPPSYGGVGDSSNLEWNDQPYQAVANEIPPSQAGQRRAPVGWNGQSHGVHHGKMQSPAQNQPRTRAPEWYNQPHGGPLGKMQTSSQTHLHRSYTPQLQGNKQQGPIQQAGRGQVPPGIPMLNGNTDHQNMPPSYRQPNGHQAGMQSVPTSYITDSHPDMGQISRNPMNTVTPGSQLQHQSSGGSGMQQGVDPANMYHPGMGGMTQTPRRMHSQPNYMGVYAGMTQTPPRMISQQNYMGAHQSTPQSHRRVNSQPGPGLSNIPPSPHVSSDPFFQDTNQVRYQQNLGSMGPRHGPSHVPSHQLYQNPGMLPQGYHFNQPRNDNDILLMSLKNMDSSRMQRSMAQPPSPRSASAAQRMMRFGFPPQPPLGEM